MNKLIGHRWITTAFILLALRILRISFRIDHRIGPWLVLRFISSLELLLIKWILFCGVHHIFHDIWYLFTFPGLGLLIFCQRITNILAMRRTLLCRVKLFLTHSSFVSPTIRLHVLTQFQKKQTRLFSYRFFKNTDWRSTHLKNIWRAITIAADRWRK